MNEIKLDQTSLVISNKEFKDFSKVFDKEIMFQRYLSTLNKSFLIIDQDFFEHFDQFDFQMIFENISLFIQLRPFLRDELVQVLIHFDKKFSISFFRFFEKDLNPVFLRLYYLLKGLSFDEIIDYVKIKSDDLKFHFAKELNLNN